MSPVRFAPVFVALAACASAPPEGERWAFATGTPTEDGCGLQDVSDAVIAGKWFHEPGPDGVQWTHEPDGHTYSPIDCEERGDDLSCLPTPLLIRGEPGHFGWIRGTYSADRTSFSGDVTVVRTCGAQLCGNVATGYFRPCRSVLPVSAGLVADTYPGACPPEGTKSVPGAPAVVKLMKGSRAEGLKLGELDAEGALSPRMDVPTAEGEIAFGWQTRIGVWFIVYTRSGGQEHCQGAFLVTSPEMRVVIR